MIIYKLIGENNLMDIVKTVLKNRGIDDVASFLKPSVQNVIHYSKLKNIDRAVEMFNKHNKNNSKTVTVVDRDSDGITSSAILVRYIRDNFSNMSINYLMHSKRVTGLTNEIMEQIKSIKPNLVFLPDSGTNDFEQHKELSELGIDVIVLDHHTAEGESKDAIVVNPQICLDTYPNENLSGVGVTYKFLQALDDFYNIKQADKQKTLLSIGLIADSMAMSEPETRYYVYDGLKNIDNSLIKELINKNMPDEKEVYTTHVSFKLVNFLNAVIRVGSLEEQKTMFRAMLEEEQTESRISKYRGVERTVVETLQQRAVREATNARSRQNRLKSKLTEEAVNQIKDNDLDKNAFIIVTLDKLPSGFSGLIAGQLAGQYRKPCLVLSKSDTNEGVYGGSLRGYTGAKVQNVKTFLEELKLFNFVRGHEGAAGIEITEENLKKLDKAINSKLQFTANDEDVSIPVDFVIDGKALTKSLINEVYSYERLWGKECSEPLFAITNVELNCSDIKFKSIMKTQHKGIELLSFSIDDRLQELANQGKIAVVDLIGTLSVNKFLGNETPQVKIEAIDLKKIKDAPAFGFTF